MNSFDSKVAHFNLKMTDKLQFYEGNEFIQITLFKSETARVNLLKKVVLLWESRGLKIKTSRKGGLKPVLIVL